MHVRPIYNPACGTSSNSPERRLGHTPAKKILKGDSGWRCLPKWLQKVATKYKVASPCWLSQLTSESSFNTSCPTTPTHPCVCLTNLTRPGQLINTLKANTLFIQARFACMQVSFNGRTLFQTTRIFFIHPFSFSSSREASETWYSTKSWATHEAYSLIWIYITFCSKHIRVY